VREKSRNIIDSSLCSLTSLDICRRPIQRSQDYREFLCVSISSMVYAFHSPSRQWYAANRPSQVFGDVRHSFLEYLTRQVLISVSNSRFGQRGNGGSSLQPYRSDSILRQYRCE
jgi:hypothetical protein